MYRADTLKRGFDGKFKEEFILCTVEALLSLKGTLENTEQLCEFSLHCLMSTKFNYISTELHKLCMLVPLLLVAGKNWLQSHVSQSLSVAITLILTFTFPEYGCRANMSAVCPICCEEIVETSRTSQVKRPFCVMAPAENGSIKDALGFTRK